MEHLEKRLQQLKDQKASLQLQLDEITYLIKGYENTIESQEKEKPKEEA